MTWNININYLSPELYELSGRTQKAYMKLVFCKTRTVFRVFIMGIGYWRILCLLHRIPQVTFSSLFRHRASFQYSPVMLHLSPATRILNENYVLRQCYQHTEEVGPPSQCPAKINIDSPSITQADDPDIGGGSSPLVSICFLKISGAVINKMCIEMISRIDSHHVATKR